jgi:outer membrane translocation and assembly module TamA
MVLINAEYWLTSWIDVVFFVDSGYAWNYNSEAMVKDLKTDVGFGIGMGSIDGGLMVNVAKPIEEGNQKAVVSVRLSRMF